MRRRGTLLRSAELNTCPGKLPLGCGTDFAGSDMAYASVAYWSEAVLAKALPEGNGLYVSSVRERSPSTQKGKADDAFFFLRRLLGTVTELSLDRVVCCRISIYSQTIFISFL